MTVCVQGEPRATRGLRWIEAKGRQAGYSDSKRLLPPNEVGIGIRPVNVLRVMIVQECRHDRVLPGLNHVIAGRGPISHSII